MKRNMFLIILACVMAGSMVLASCNSATTTPSTSSTTSTTKITSTTQTVSTTVTSTKVTTTSTPAATGKWWDKFGQPKYGGEMVLRSNVDVQNFDPYLVGGNPTLMAGWLERMYGDDWTLDPSIFSYNIDFRPNDYVKGVVAESWEFSDPSTYVVHLRKGVRWQDIPPVSGREFTADDVVYQYNRMEGLGGGFTKPSPNEVGGPLATDLISVTATDKYTAVFKWRKPNPEYILESIQAIGSGSCLIAHEAVEKWGDVNDWHRAIGTGPFILSDFVPGSSATFTKNKNYWGYDERYPQNKLPYVDTMKVLIIPDNATALAGIRTGKIDFVDGIPLSQANAMKKSNPEILQLTLPGASAETLEPRIDKTPFTDIRVRKAIQMAIDLPTIASSFYGGTVSPNPVPLTSPYLKGWGWPYEQWPQDLKDEYAYNPTAAKKLLADAGYPSGFKTNVIADSKGDMDLLQVAKSYLMAVGIDMSITTMDAASWLTYVRTQKKHDQMVNRNGGNTLGLSYEPLRQLQRLTTNYTSNYIILSDATIDGNYAKALAATNVETVKQLLRDDNEYVARQHFVISLLIPINFNLYQPWLKGYSGQARSISGQYTPFFLGFYGARFWVDSAMKQSMGH